MYSSTYGFVYSIVRPQPTTPELAVSRVLMPLPRFDFDPTESGVPWLELSRRGHDVVFATPDGKVPKADCRMLYGEGLGLWRALLMADSNGRSAHNFMAESPAYARPLAYEQVRIEDFDAILLPGGHASGMREYLESTFLQALVAAAFTNSLIVGAICHGVVLAARSRLPNGDFDGGPAAILRDTPDRIERGFVIRDGNYLSARWPGDAHRFAHVFSAMLEEPKLARSTQGAA